MNTRLAKFALLALVAVTASACNENTLADRPEPPVAVISGPVSYAPLDTAVFDGSGSYTQEGASIVSYTWAIVSAPTGSTSQAANDPAAAERGNFWIDFAGDYVISLTVTDDRGLSGVAEYPFSAVPWQKVHIELAWDKAGTDMDLHLVSETEGGAFFSEPFDCFFQNTNPDWGVPGSTLDDPSIDIDDVDGFGPENVSLNQPRDDHRYHVYVHYYDDYGMGSSNATVRIYLSGMLRYEGIMPLDGQGSGWDVATISWPTGEIESVGGGFEFNGQ